MQRKAYFKGSKLGMVMGQVFSGTYPALPLMGRGSILINGFGMGLGIFLKPGAGSGIAPSHPNYI